MRLYVTLGKAPSVCLSFFICRLEKYYYLGNRIG